METKIQNEKPCLVETPQGFSVFYRNKFLYSKYAPARSICQTIEKLALLPGTLFLCCSPVLTYGLSELLSKLDDSSFCLLCEFDSQLDAFSRERPDFSKIKDMKKAARLTLPELQQLPVILNQPSYTTMEGRQLLPAGTFKRVIRLDFSAGTQFHNELYDELTAACTTAIMTFWANRMTLVKFGRKYSQNFFKNLKILAQTSPIKNFFGSVSKPIIVFGAGESTDKGIKKIKDKADDFFIICADTALQPLLKNGIKADAVFVEEAQSVIKKAFIGTKNNKTRLFAGMSAAANLYKIFGKERLSFFTTKYSSASFLKRLSDKKIIPPMNEAFGSVGLTALYYALRFRSSEDIPVFIYGLDFSYSAGLTHAKGSMAVAERHIRSTRLLPPASYAAAFNTLAEKVLSKDGRCFYTTRTLKNYAELFKGLFCGIKNLFDSSDCGINLNLPYKEPQADNTVISAPLQPLPFSNEEKKVIQNYLLEEKKILERLRDLLTGKEKLTAEEQRNQITKLASEREYLFLHFADGINFKYETSFLKRIRTEIDFFLKFF